MDSTAKKTPSKTPIKSTTATPQKKNLSILKTLVEEPKTQPTHSPNDIKIAIRHRRAKKEEELKQPHIPRPWEKANQSKPRKPSSSVKSRKSIRAMNNKDNSSNQKKPDSKSITKALKEKKKLIPRKYSRSRSVKVKAKAMRSSNSKPKTLSTSTKKIDKKVEKMVKKDDGSLKELLSELKSLKLLIKDNANIIKKENSVKAETNVKSTVKNVLLDSICDSLKNKSSVELRYQLVEWIRQHYGNKTANELMGNIGLPTSLKKSPSNNDVSSKKGTQNK